jgi:hypothetical protein
MTSFHHCIAEVCIINIKCMCEFLSLYYKDDGYVVQCKDCSYYQLAFGSTMLSLSPEDFEMLTRVVRNKFNEIDFNFSENARNVVIPTPSHGLFMLLTKEEANRFHEILEAADTEAKAQQMLAMFQA